jgi:hypothetical protein
MRGDENRVIDAQVTWLKRSNWTVRRGVNFIGVYAERGRRGFTLSQRAYHIARPGR